MNNLNYEQFKQAVADKIKNYLPEKYEDSKVELKQVLKNNDTIYDAVIVKDPDSNISPTIYLNQFYEEYKNGKELNSIIKNIADIYIAHTMDMHIDTLSLMDFNKSKDIILPRLVNAEKNQEMLAQRPHMIIDDLAVTYHLELGQSENGSMSIAITNEMLNLYGISQEELHNLAIANLEKNVPVYFKGMNDVIREMMIPDFVKNMGVSEEIAHGYIDKIIPDCNEHMYVLSNNLKLNGAAVILNEKAMADIINKIGGNFYILPSSTHELLIVPKEKDMSITWLENMVQDVNITQVDVEERLSDHVYEYDANEKKLYRADKAKEYAQKIEQKCAI